MRWLIIVLFLVSFGSVCMAGVGDAYYCVMNNQIKIIADGRYFPYKGNKFKFQWKDNEIVFGKGGFFDGQRIKIRNSFPNQEAFRASAPDISRISFDSPTFLYSLHSYGNAVYVVTAKCDKF